MESKEKKLHFLNGGGEMGALIRSYNWADTSLGAPDQWSGSLRTTVGIILHSAFPMFLFWGKDLICFYNDAFRPSLGAAGKHPAIGMRGEDVWRDAWDFAEPLIHQVITTGEPVYFEDRLVPFERNGRKEDVYWTFSYSPVFGDHGTIEGVFVTCTETTKNVHTIKRLEQSQKRFQALVRDATVGIIVLTGENNVVEIVNVAYCSLVGRSCTELLNKPLFELIPEAKPYFGPIIEEVRITGNPVFQNAQPHVIVTGDGQEKSGHLNLVYQPYREEDGSITGVMISCHDVTAQVEALNRVQKSEQQIRTMVESAPFPIAVYIGDEMRIELANQAIINIYGKGNDVIGKTYTGLLPELEGQELFNQVRSVLKTGIPFHARNQRVDLVVDGILQPFYFHYSYTPLFDSQGKVFGVMNTGADVTDLHMAKQKVEQSERNLRNMILQAPVAMCILLGPNHIVEVANEDIMKIWGKVPEQVMHKPIFEGLPEAREQGLEELLAHVYNTGETFTANERPVELPRNGRLEIKYINFVYEPYYDGDTIAGILAVAVEVTDQVMARRRIEDVVAERTSELAAANVELQRSNAELEQFAYIASHDLQEPLRKVTTYAQMLGQTLGEIDERPRGYLAKIEKSTTRMGMLIRDVLTYSQLSREITYEPVNLEAVVDSVLSDLELVIEQKQAVINYADLPVIDAIPLQMSQLFGNLISNALKFVKQGESPVVNITARQLTAADKEHFDIRKVGGDHVVLQVQDNGIGFDQAHAQRIFNIFQRLHVKTQYSGTGIGLAICKKIAQNHHGYIFAASQPGQGATFSVILPVKQRVAP